MCFNDLVREIYSTVVDLEVLENNRNFQMFSCYSLAAFNKAAINLMEIRCNLVVPKTASSMNVRTIYFI